MCVFSSFVCFVPAEAYTFAIIDICHAYFPQQMAFERTIRHVNEAKEESKFHTHSNADAATSEGLPVVDPSAEQTPVTELPQAAAANPPAVQSAAEIAENKKQAEIAAKAKAELVKLMTNQRKLNRAKEKRESKIKEQLDSIAVSDAEQRFAKVQQNKAANVSRNMHLRLS